MNVGEREPARVVSEWSVADQDYRLVAIERPVSKGIRLVMERGEWDAMSDKRWIEVDSISLPNNAGANLETKGLWRDAVHDDARRMATVMVHVYLAANAAAKAAVKLRDSLPLREHPKE